MYGEGGVLTPGLIDIHSHIGLYEDGLGFEGADGNEAVSYTHLDVYKRQDTGFILYLFCEKEKSLFQIFSSKTEFLPDCTAVLLPFDSASAGRIPVSYTHLDVYKRQVQFQR